MLLTDAAIRRAKPKDKPYQLTDGEGLYLLVQPSGACHWRFAYRFAGKPNLLSFGKYPDVPLTLARERRTTARQQVAAGVDPAALRKAAKRRTTSGTTFALLAAEFVAQQADTWAPATTEKATYHLALASRILGEREVASIEPPELLAVLRDIERRGHIETAHSVKQRAGQVFRYAIATGRATRDPSADLRGALKPIPRTHRAALTAPADVGRLMRAIRAYDGSRIVAAALQLLPLVFVRPVELRLAEWSEFDLDGAEPIWRIPADRMKEREPHLVPLSRQALAVLREAHRVSGPRLEDGGAPALVFPSRLGRRTPISENTLNNALRRLGFGAHEMTAHGFRTMASTRLHEAGWNTEIIERQLAHQDPNAVRAVYNRAQHLEQRRTMMQSWADYLDQLQRLPVR